MDERFADEIIIGSISVSKCSSDTAVPHLS
jgi:hypothetical protein